MSVMIVAETEFKRCDGRFGMVVTDGEAVSKLMSFVGMPICEGSLECRNGFIEASKKFCECC